MKRLNFITGFLLAMLFITSCGKSSCLDQGIHISFNGFDTTMRANIIVQEYKSNSNFSTLVSVHISDTTDTTNQVHQTNDTIYFPPNNLLAGIDIASGYDYKIILPFANRTFTVSDIAYHQASRHFSNGGGCTNDVSYYLNGTPYSVTGVSFNQASPPPVNIVLNK